MTSQIAPNAIDTAFPKKYSDNDSQAFRDNFELIKSNFQIARDEITQLQLTPPLTIDTIPNLRLMPLDGVTSGTSINVLGYNSPGDGGGGLLYWKDPSVVTDDNATIIGSVDSLTGHWLREKTDCVSLKWFGATGSGITDDSVAVQAAISYAIANQVALYVPAGTYLLGPAVHSITATLTAATPSFSMFGDGVEVSIFKESDDRVTTSGYTDCKMLYITTTEHANSVTVTGIRFDKNGSSTTPLAPGSSENINSHSISVSIKTSGFLDSLTLADLRFSDKIGSHINFTSGQIDTVYITNCNFDKFAYTGAEVGDIECKATIRRFVADTCNGKLVRVNPTDVAALNDNPVSILLVNSHFDDAVLSGFSEQAADMTVTVDTCELSTMSASTLKLLANNSQIGITSRPWEQLVNGSLISNSEITITSDGLNRTVPWDFNPDTIDFDCKLTVSNCSIVGDATFDNAVSGFAIESTGWYSGVTNFEITFNDCEFDPRFSKIVNANSKGNFRFNRCKLAGQDTFAQVGSSIQGTDHAYGTVEVTSCDLSQVGTTLFEFNLDIDSSAYVKIKGDHPYDKWAFSNVGDMFASARIPGSVIFEGKWLSSAAPTGPGIETQVVEISSAVYGDPCQYIAFTTSDTSAVWEIKDRAIAGITQSELDLAIASVGVSAVASDLTDETNVRIAADGVLQGNINAVAGDLTDLAAVVDALPVITITEGLIANYASTTNIAIDIGITPNVYSLASQAPLFEAPTVLQTGTQVRFKAGVTNTGLSTLDYLGSTPTTLLRNDGTNLQAGDLSTASYNLVTYVVNGSVGTWRLQNPVSASASSAGVAQFATSIETASGISTKAVTPAGFLAQFTGSNQNLSSSGSQKFPGGFTIKWGVVTVSADSDLTVNFTTATGSAFTTACVGVMVTEILDNAGLVNYVRLKSAPTVNSAIIQNANSISQVAYWVAFGY